MVKLRNDSHNVKDHLTQFAHWLSPLTKHIPTGDYSEQVKSLVINIKKGIRQLTEDLTTEEDLAAEAKMAEIKAKKLMHKMEHALTHDLRLSKTAKTALKGLSKDLAGLMQSIHHYMEQHFTETSNVSLPKIDPHQLVHQLKKTVDVSLQRAKQHKAGLPQQTKHRITIPKGSGRN